MTNQTKIFEKFLNGHKLKFTSERKIILNEVLKIINHFDADELFLKIKQKGKKVSRGSIYRTLPLLVKSGIIRKVAFIERHTHYEQIYGRKHHEHLICTKCGRIIEFFDQRIKQALDYVIKENEFEVEGHKVEITGLCKKCQSGR